MGRRVPLPVDDISVHPVLSFSIFLAGMVAAIAMVTTLCGVRFRRRSSEPAKGSSRKESEGQDLKPMPSFVRSLSKIKTEPEKIVVNSVATGKGRSESEDSAEEIQVKELPLPPAKQLKSIHSCNQNLMTKSASTRNLISTMSMKLPRSFSMARNNNRGDQKEEPCSNQKKKGKLKPEDSVWMKTIILGEKCKVPHDDEVTIYDGKGNRISTYHPKTTASLPVSRQNSQIDTNAIPAQDRTSINLPISPFSRPVSRQSSPIDLDAFCCQDRGKSAAKNSGEFS